LKRSFKIAFLSFALVAILAGLAWWLARPSEPLYQGQSLTFWYSRYTFVNGVGTAPNFYKGDEAARYLGTNAIPELLRMIKAKDSALTLDLITLAQKQHLIKFKHPNAVWLNYIGAKGISVLGPRAKEAVPALISIYEQKISQSSQAAALLALGYIGPEARPAYPVVLGAITNADVWIRAHAVGALVNIVEPAELRRADPGVLRSTLDELLDDPDPRVQDTAKKGLRMLAHTNDEPMPFKQP